ncbi:hypothetical protein [Sinomonas halotolerans]|uniref:Tetratricopeptide repeat protein n=1 Tax=Sinomonas halotolerans TaxID=1644133 RepID=A0ABU9X121_9MICC
MASGELHRQPSYHDPRDLTPFRRVLVYAPVRGLGRRVSDRLARRARVPRLRRFPSKPERLVHAAVFGAGEPERLVLLARAHPSWAGLAYVVAGLHAYRAHQHAQAAELLGRGLTGPSGVEAAAFAAQYLEEFRVWVEVAEGVEVEAAFGEEAVCLALAHSLREVGRPRDALAALETLPPSLPAALAACRLAEVLGRPADVVDRTRGLTNSGDLAAVLLVLRARALRTLGRRAEAHAALREVLRRRRTALPVKNAAATERALLMLGAVRLPRGAGLGRVTPNGGSAGPGQLRRAEDADAADAWLRDFERLTGEREG